MTDIITILTCDKCGLLYRASLIPHECAEWTKGRNKHEGDMMERQEQDLLREAIQRWPTPWQVVPATERNNTDYILKDANGHKISLMANYSHWKLELYAYYANQHATLTEQRDRLVGILQRARAAAQIRSDLHERLHGTPTRESWVEDADNALATVEQGEGA